jgi:hypothetical protein
MTASFLPKDEDWRFVASLFCLRDLSLWPNANEVVRVLESVAAPEYWGEDSSVNDDYTRRAIEQHFAKGPPGADRFPLILKRATSPRYTSSVNIGTSIHPQSVHVESSLRHRKGEIEQLFDLVDTLANHLDIDFGSIDIFREGQDFATRVDRSGHGENLKPYIRVGPQWIWIRTYIGPRLVALGGGAATWQACGGMWRYFKNGTMALDLKEKPWACKPEDLKAEHSRLMPEMLRRTGVFHYEDEDEEEIPGPRWQPPPGAKWPG